MKPTRICLTNSSADILYRYFAQTGAELVPSSLQPYDFSADLEPHLEVLREYLGGDMELVNVLVGRRTDWRVGPGLACHGLYGALPPSSVMHVEGGVYVASANLNLLLQARELHLVNLCQMLGRYWGTFETEPTESGEDKLFERAPLSNEEWLSQYIHDVSTPGTAVIRNAMRYTCPYAASPQEVNLQLALCLPASCNGFALRKPMMNYPYVLDPSERAFYDVENIKVDLCWPDANFGLEYLGEEEHKDTMLKDIARWYAARKKGIELWFVTKEQLYDPRQLDFIAREVARRTNKRVIEGTWPTEAEVTSLLAVLMGRRHPKPEEVLRTRALRARRKS